ncbi:MAG TPA: sigma 54-interacting transcriptional regulator [Pyrinomonadaceae bacterium]|nr:sigma 54-interacting transcriptional regulator [Pyrinomonadaceae bacterium]
MNSHPKLAAIAGPLKDSVHVLAGEEFSLGRESANTLSVGDGLLSRRHCVIRREGDEYKIYDLDSLNGTFVNGVPVKERRLAHGDRVSAGGSHFVFLLPDAEVDTTMRTTPVQLEEGEVVAATTLRLRIEDALYLSPEKLAESVPPLERLAGDFRALLKVSTTISSIRDSQELQHRLLELVFEVVPAERGAIILTDVESDDVVSVCGLDRAGASEQEAVQVSRTVVRQAVEQASAVLSNNVLSGEAFASAESLRSSYVRSLVCVPLVLFGQSLGAIYLTTTDAATRFTEEHLQLLTVVASVAAVALKNAQHVERLEDENRQLRDDVQIEHNMVGEGERMREVYRFIARVAPTPATVLVRGESGTGKELAARAIHQNSPRAARQFAAINCAALAETLLESELFGHEKGAFTGAVGQRRGRLEAAEGGTVFLDEVGEMSPALQTKLLRVLQEREFERVGGTQTISVDVRVVAATNRDLEQAIKDGTFRRDLYYRLNVVSFEMPPLRERREDIPMLASYFAKKYATKFNRKVSGLSAAARACLVSYDWPGNVRELENAVERAVVLGSTDLILPEDLPETLLEAATPQGAGAAGEGGGAGKYHEAVREAKRQLILSAVEQSGGQLTEAARLLGVHPNYLHRLIRNLNLKEMLRKQ